MQPVQPPIADYALIGDGRCAALVARGGSIDWLCWPRFDSPPWLARLLDREHGGAWSIAPIEAARIERAYVPRTNVLATTFVTANGRAVLVDAMAVADERDKRRELACDHELVRLVTCEAGEVEIAMTIDPRPDFGRARVRVEDGGQLGIRWHTRTTLVTLRAEVPLHLGDDGRVRATARLRAGESVAFSLSFDADAPAVVPVLGPEVRARLARSIEWWRAWIERARYDGPDRELVLRSALALKLLAYAPSGAIVAAPTTSLPERPGGDLNWDYRYCWLRDASFTARVLLSLGYTEDAHAFCGWLLHTTRLTRPELSVLYDVYGKLPKREETVGDVTGYAGALPVRLGNLAAAQLQLDTYGEVIDATAQVLRVVGATDHETSNLLREFGGYVAAHWQLPDSGIWEPREPERHRTHSRLACWLALDRLVELGERGLVSGVDITRMTGEREAIRRDIEQGAWDAENGCYSATLPPSELDASVLLMSYYGFHDAASPRMTQTFARLRERLGAGPGLLYRYERSIPEREGAFWICSFWAVEHLARGGGSLADARRWFADACSYANDLGLMAEEIDPTSTAQLGNFPQAYTHVGLVSAALSIEQRREMQP
jgi:GH15 family glucan-1,4-alpha-glucosidase